MNCTESSLIVLIGVCIATNLFVTLLQIPWLIYFVSKFRQVRSKSAALKRINDESRGCQSLLQKYKNTKILYKYFIAATTSEFLTMSLTIFSNTSTLTTHYFVLQLNLDCGVYYFYFMMYLYAKYFIEFLSAVCLMGLIEVLNFTTKFAINVFILNRNSGKEKKTRNFIIKIVLLVALALSGIGMIVAFILVEVLLVKESIQFYQNSRELYKKLRMMYEDVKYEFGDTHLNTRSARKNLVHYKRFTLWFSMVVFVGMIASVFFVFRIPFNLVAEQCVLENITSYKCNPTFIEEIRSNEILKNVSIILILLGKVIHVLFMVLFIPFYTLFSLYYLCNKLLFVNVYPHRYHVGSSGEADDRNTLLMQN